MKKAYKPPKKKPNLKRCPFCGGEADIRAFSVIIEYSISCTTCGIGTWDHETVEECVELWNKRNNHEHQTK